MKNASHSSRVSHVHEKKELKKKSSPKKEKKAGGEKTASACKKEKKKRWIEVKEEKKEPQKKRGKEDRKKKESHPGSKQYCTLTASILPQSRKIEKRLKSLQGLGEKFLKKLKICIEKKTPTKETGPIAISRVLMYLHNGIRRRES